MVQYMHRNKKYVSGVLRHNKRRGNKRDLSDNTYYKSQNYNKIHKQKGITPFTWNTNCTYANRIYRKKDKIVQMKEELNAHNSERHLFI
jgi:hypothetical protein